MDTYEKTRELQNAWAWRMGDSIFFDLENETSLIEALGYTKPEKMPRIISFVGGSGKTTSMNQLAHELRARGFKVLMETAAYDSCPEGLADPECLEKLLETTDFILIEADDAAQHPIKIPDAYEPAIIPQTGLVIACAGLSAVGKAFGESCFRFGTCGSWLMRRAEDLIDAEDISLILMDGRGSRKNLEGRYYKIILNQADTEQDLEHAKQIICALPGILQLDVVVTRYKNDL